MDLLYRSVAWDLIIILPYLALSAISIDENIKNFLNIQFLDNAALLRVQSIKYDNFFYIFWNYKKTRRSSRIEPNKWIIFDSRRYALKTIGYFDIEIAGQYLELRFIAWFRWEIVKQIFKIDVFIFLYYIILKI